MVAMIAIIAMIAMAVPHGNPWSRSTLAFVHDICLPRAKTRRRVKRRKGLWNAMRREILAGESQVQAGLKLFPVGRESLRHH